MNAHLLVERRGAVLYLTLNRPAALNALLPEMMDDLRAALDAVGDARAVLISGAGRGFCAGADVAAAPAPRDDARELSFHLLERHVNPLLLSLAHAKAPIVASVRGPIAGIGCSLALGADFCVASETAYFDFAYARLGLSAEGGASFFLPRLVGRAKALELLLLDERCNAARAQEWGLVGRVVPDHNLDEAALALTERLAAGPTRALEGTRRLITDGLDVDFEAALRMEALNQRRIAGTADAHEGLSAFRQKRTAAFEGR